MPYDLRLDGQRMDLATPEGFSNALWSVARLRPGSGHLTAPVCSTFVFVWLGRHDMGSPIFLGFSPTKPHRVVVSTMPPGVNPHPWGKLESGMFQHLVVFSICCLVDM